MAHESTSSDCDHCRQREEFLWTEILHAAALLVRASEAPPSTPEAPSSACSPAATICALRQYKAEQSALASRRSKEAEETLAAQRRNDPALQRRKTAAEATLVTGTLADRIYLPTAATLSPSGKASSRASSLASSVASSVASSDTESDESDDSSSMDTPLLVPESKIHKQFSPAKWPQLVRMHADEIKAILHNPTAHWFKRPRKSKLNGSEKRAVHNCVIFPVHKGSQSIKLLAHRAADGCHTFLRVIVSEHLGNENDTARRQYLPPKDMTAGMALSAWLKLHEREL